MSNMVCLHKIAYLIRSYPLPGVSPESRIDIGQCVYCSECLSLHDYKRTVGLSPFFREPVRGGPLEEIVLYTKEEVEVKK